MYENAYFLKHLQTQGMIKCLEFCPLIDSKSNSTIFSFCMSLIMNEKGNFSCWRAVNISLSISYSYCLPHWIVGLLICKYFLYVKEILYLGLDLWILFPVCCLSFIILMACVCLCVCNCFWKCSICFKNALTGKSRLYLLFKKSEGSFLHHVIKSFKMGWLGAPGWLSQRSMQLLILESWLN